MTKKELQLKIGLEIKKIRENKGISQTSLAYQCNFEKSNMNRIESGNTNITSYNLYIITEALQISLSDFFRGIEKDA